MDIPLAHHKGVNTGDCLPAGLGQGREWCQFHALVTVSPQDWVRGGGGVSFIGTGDCLPAGLGQGGSVSSIGTGDCLPAGLGPTPRVTTRLAIRI